MRHMLTLSKNAKREDLDIKHYEGRLFQFPNCVNYFYNYYLDIIPHIKTYPLEMNNDRRFRNETYNRWFQLPICVLSILCSNIQAAPEYGVYIFQVIRFSWLAFPIIIS